MKQPLLIGLSYSPWTEKARWALDHHGVAYRYSEHVPMIGEALLRARTKRWTGRVTVPALIDGDRAFTDSFAIAEHAEAVGHGPPLLPASSLGEIREWNALSEEALAASRAIVTFKTGASREAKVESLPAFVPGPLRALGAPIAGMGVRFFVRKYGLDEQGLTHAEARIAGVLECLRKALAPSRPFLLDDFSYADVVMAVSMQGVLPVSDRFIRLGPATRAAWTRDSLASRFADLLAWRDAVYAKHRPKR
jgi:glutathione S-transferase